MKCNVVIPKPKASRMDKEKKIVIEKSNGWTCCGRTSHTIPANQQGFEFEIPDDYEYVFNRTMCDGPTFNVWVEYSNESGTRKEKVFLVPEVVA